MRLSAGGGRGNEKDAGTNAVAIRGAPIGGLRDADCSSIGREETIYVTIHIGGLELDNRS